MADTFEGTYFDGRNGYAHAAVLRRVGERHFALDGDGIARGGAIRDLSITPPLARVARTVEFADGARLLLPHDAAIDDWFPHRDRLEALVDRMERHAHAVAAAIFVCLATLVVGAKWGVPWAADRIADKVPPAVERSLGEQVLENLDRIGLKASRLDAERRAALTARFAKLTGGLDGAADYRVEFRNAPGVGANAFALPGGTIVVTDQLVDMLYDDREFDAVVAHEIGHEQHRHALRQTLRSSFVAIVAAFFAGDVSSASAVVVAIPTFLLNSHYSRGFEAEADGFAFDLLARHGESPRWFAVVMSSLSARAPEDSRLAYLSSHPPSAARIAAADAAATAFAAAHPDLCPNGVCPDDSGDDSNVSDCADCDDDPDAIRDDAAHLSCNKPDDG